MHIAEQEKNKNTSAYTQLPEDNKGSAREAKDNGDTPGFRRRHPRDGRRRPKNDLETMGRPRRRLIG